MASEHPENWFLKKHENGEIFGPVPFDQIRAWAGSAQINPQDLVSNDQVVWTKPPMLPELGMDWLVELDATLLYGPTTGGTLLEFLSGREVNAEMFVINCVDGTRCRLRETRFYEEAQAAPPTEHAAQAQASVQPVKGSVRVSLQRRVRELEEMLLEKQRHLGSAREKIRRLEARVQELEARLGAPPVRG